MILFILFLLLIGLFFYQVNRTAHFKNLYEDQVKETTRISNNYLASQDTIRTYKDKNGSMVSEISGYQITSKELDTKYKSLFNLYLKEKNKTPKVIIEYKYIMKDTLNSKTNVSDSLITYGGDTIKYAGNNWTLISGKIPYQLSCNIKKSSVTQYAYDRAKVYSYDLRERGLSESKVVAYKNNNLISITDALKDSASIFRVMIKQSQTDVTDDISKVIDKDLVDKYYDNSNKMYTFVTGVFIPNSSIDIKNSEFKPKLFTGMNQTYLQSAVEINTGLYKDKDGRLMIDIKTKHPNISFTSITGAEILNAENTKKLERQVRKQFGFGMNIGIGAMLAPDNSAWVMKYGPQISIGLNWTPRWAQFGASKKLSTLGE